MPPRTILLNWVYYHPVGHAVEAFKVAKGLWNANENCEIDLLLNGRTAVELAEACDWIHRAYPIDVESFAEGGAGATYTRDLPAAWDFVVTDHRPTCSPFPFSTPLRAFHDFAARHFQARIWKGGHHELRQPGAPGYEQNSTIQMHVPDAAREFVQRLKLGRVNISVMLAGSSPDPIYPTIDWWRRALFVLQNEFPDAHFFVTGKTAGDDRTSTQAFSQAAFARLAAGSERIFNWCDIGIWNQMALFEQSDLLISPHTGFAFLAPSVGTPWLAVSGARWPECYFNDVPFYCVLPDCPQYPCWMEMKDVCRERLLSKETVPCMLEELEGKFFDLIHGVHLLLSAEFSFEKAMALYRARIEQMGFPPERFFQIV